MRKARTLYTVVLLGTLAVALAGCEIDLSGLNALDAYAEKMAQGAVVADVRCGPAVVDGLEIATSEEGNCMAFDSAGTRIAVDNNPIVRWRSTLPEAVAVALDGRVFAGTVADTSWVVAEGSYDSADSVQVWSY